MRKALLLGVLLLFAPLQGASQTPVLPVPPASGWEKAGAPAEFEKSQLFDYIDGGAEIFLEFGFDRLLVQEYAKGDSTIVLEVYQMASPESALGIYLQKCGAETPVEGIPARNSGDYTQLTILKGRSFIHVNNLDGGATLLPVLIGLASRFLESIPEGPAVTLLDGLPEKDRIRGSERLIRGPYALQSIYTLGEGDILDLRGEVFALAADYRDQENEPSTRLVVPYPDEQRAERAFRGLLANLDPYLKVIAKRERGFVFRDFRGRFGTVEWSGSRLELWLNLNSAPADPAQLLRKPAAVSGGTGLM
jgi:hypothetical protein